MKQFLFFIIQSALFDEDNIINVGRTFNTIRDKAFITHGKIHFR